MRQTHSMTKNLTNKTNPKSKKWLVVSIVLAIILLPLLYLDISSRIEYNRYLKEAERIGSYTNSPKSGVKNSYTEYQKGNGLLTFLDCKFFIVCPIVNVAYDVKIEPGQEIEYARKTLTDAGYVVEPIDINQEAECDLNIDSCSFRAVNGEFRAVMFIANEGDGKPTIVKLRTSPNY